MRQPNTLYGLNLLIYFELNEFTEKNFKKGQKDLKRLDYMIVTFLYSYIIILYYSEITFCGGSTERKNRRKTRKSKFKIFSIAVSLQ